MGIESYKYKLEHDIQVPKKEDTHLKGYIFDSLVYRYKLAREKAMQYELCIAKQACSGKETAIVQIAERDVMKFIQILNEAIGEHD